MSESTTDQVTPPETTSDSVTTPDPTEAPTSEPTNSEASATDASTTEPTVTPSPTSDIVSDTSSTEIPSSATETPGETASPSSTTDAASVPTETPIVPTAVVRFIEPNTNLSFALTNVENGTQNDLYMHLQIPESYGWGGVGIGDEMTGSTVFIIYPGGEANTTTLSVRQAGGHYEPEPDSEVACTLVDHFTDGGLVDASFICQNGNDSRLTSDPSAANWIWAAGPGVQVQNDSASATIEQHSTSGYFTLNMTEAKFTVDPASTQAVAIPMISNVDLGVSDAYTDVPPSDNLIDAHAFLLAGSFLILFPLGVLLLRWRSSSQMHRFVQLLGTGCCILGLLIALIMSAKSTEYHEFDHFHQVIGIISVLCLIPQAAMGYWNHKTYKETGVSTWLAVPHLNLGRAVMVLGLVAGISGFALHGSTWSAVGYSIASLLVICGLTWFLIGDRRKKSRLAGERHMMATLGVKDGQTPGRMG